MQCVSASEALKSEYGRFAPNRLVTNKSVLGGIKEVLVVADAVVHACAPELQGLRPHAEGRQAHSMDRLECARRVRGHGSLIFLGMLHVDL